jgi:hypothetical protein
VRKIIRRYTNEADTEKKQRFYDFF